MSHRPAFIEHQALTSILPHLLSYVQKGLEETGANGTQFRVTEKEAYAASVAERVGELDNSVKSLRIALGFILDLKNTDEGATDLYRYHYENLLLRLTGIVDRAHRLVGTSLRLNPSKLEKIGANEFVTETIASDYPDLFDCLKTLTVAANKYKKLRNDVAHSKAFSTRELGLFSAITSLNLEVGNTTQVKELMDSYFSEGGTELALVVAEMVRGIEALLGALAPIHDHLLSASS